VGRTFHFFLAKLENNETMLSSDLNFLISFKAFWIELIGDFQTVVEFEVLASLNITSMGGLAQMSGPRQVHVSHRFHMVICSSHD
jgi:hypothetical protein